MTVESISIERRNTAGAAALRSSVEDVYRRAYAERIASGVSFGTPEAFMNRFDSYLANPEFAMVVAVRDGLPIGQAWGWPLSQQSCWWNGLEYEPEPGFTTENGSRTFALSEIMVDVAHTGRGVARLLHDHLLGARTEDRATLLVNPTNDRARNTYIRWGWSAVARLRPGWPDAPLLDVMIHTLNRQD